MLEAETGALQASQPSVSPLLTDTRGQLVTSKSETTSGLYLTTHRLCKSSGGGVEGEPHVSLLSAEKG